MSKIYNNLIWIFGILAIIFGFLLASPADASNDYSYLQTTYSTAPNPLPSYVRPMYYNNYVNDYAYNYVPQSQPQPIYYPQPIQNQIPPTPMVIAGCEGRNTGYSITSGQSCVGNLITTSNTSSNTTNNSSSTSVKKTTTNTSNTSEIINTSEDVNASDINESYSGLAANALFGSSGFMPSGILQWILLIILILAIIFLWRYVNAEERYLAEPLKHA